jgi:hypothetical protein
MAGMTIKRSIRGIPAKVLLTRKNRKEAMDVAEYKSGELVIGDIYRGIVSSLRSLRTGCAGTIARDEGLP